MSEVKRKVAFIDLTEFYGGGQKFVWALSSEMSDAIDPYFIVANDKLYRDIDLGKKYYVNPGVRSQVSIINKILKTENIHIAFLNGNRPIYLAPFLRCKYKIGFKHTSNNALSGMKKLLGVPLLHCCYAFCTKIVVLFEKAQNEILFFRHKTVVVNNGISLQEHYGEGLFDPLVTFICVTRLDENKGLKWLVSTFSKQFRNNSDTVQLVIVGDGPYRPTLENLIRQTKVSNISLTGFAEDVSGYLKAADVFVLPSKFESFPLSILEAMKFGLPIIATDTGGVSEMIKGNGYLITYLDNKGIKTAMKELYDDAGLRSRLGQQSVLLVKEKFSLEKTVRKIEDLIYQIE